MDPTLTTFLFEVINFLLLAGVLGWLLFKPVRAAMERERATREKELQDAAEKLAAANKLEQEIKSRYAALEQDLERMRNAAREAAEQEAQELRQAARAAAQQERETLRQRLAQLEGQQAQQLARAVAHTAGAAIQRLLAQLDGPNLQRGLVQSACRQLQQLPGPWGAVTVESAAPLDDDLPAQIKTALGPGVERLDYRVLPELGSGVRIRTASGVIDASEAELARFAVRELARNLSVVASNGRPNGASDGGASHAAPADAAVS